MPEPPVPAEHLALRELIAAGGADPIEEHGVLAGEVRGLEVCRAVDDPSGEPLSRSASVPTTAASRSCTAASRPPSRSPAWSPSSSSSAGWTRHCTCSIGWLGSGCCAGSFVTEPSLIDAATLAPVAPPVPRLNVKDAVPCVAAGRDAPGAAIVVVCSTGVDLDLILSPPTPGWRRSRVRCTGRRAVVVVTPARDRVKVTERLAGLLRRPCELATHG